MRRAFRVGYGLLSAAAVGLPMGMRVHAEQPQPYPYTFSMTPEAGPLDPSIEKHYTAQWSACQTRAVSTQAHEACYAAEFERHDKVLNWTWGATLARIAPSFRGRLVAAQRKWVAERDPFCNSQADKFREGTIAPVIYLDCRVEQTIRRTLWLRQLR